jgi:hypothetical protein
LAVGDIFYAADRAANRYTVHVTEVSGSPNGWSGRGYLEMLLPMGITQNVAVKFDNILINRRFAAAMLRDE